MSKVEQNYSYRLSLAKKNQKIVNFRNLTLIFKLMPFKNAKVFNDYYFNDEK